MKDLELYILGAVLIFVVLSFLKDGKCPPTDSFKCARCKKHEKYTSRTVEAWKKGFKKIYCQSCHRLWLKDNPAKIKQNYSTSSGGGGCLGMVFLILVVPPSIYGLAAYVS